MTAGRSAAVGCEVVIDLGAIAANYRALCARAGARVGAVVKSNAYGLGVGPVAHALRASGCQLFFVATLEEGLELRGALDGDTDIVVLNGVWSGEETLAAEAGVTPVLNSRRRALAWAREARRLARPLPAVLQVDSGMSRLGMTPEDLAALSEDADTLSAMRVRFVMSHLACADTPGHPANAAQTAQFAALVRALPPLDRSFSNSAAILAGVGGPSDVPRAGLALFGVAPQSGDAADLRPAVSLRARVLQRRHISAGTGVGYGHAFVAPVDMEIATLSIGYADGWPRSLEGRAAAMFGGARLPLVGRVSMDSCVVDATPAAQAPPDDGDWVTLFGTEPRLEAVAEAAGLIPYELLTGLGRRVARRWIGAPAEPVR